ncbi:MAG TPA: orotidine-5'-phosphate decarboxylase [Gaiellaceae bacterium]|nr:orotidine-5'-phosphate decarboxylase [Gaiellaceae bacterium]
MATVAVTQFSDRLAAAVERTHSSLVVGLDPVVEQLPPELDGDLDAFCRGIVDAVADHAVAVKPQSAFFEAHGADGVRAFWAACDYARSAGLLVIADAKRGDIGSTARAYADAFAGADAVTVNPYLGGDSVEPFLETCRRCGTGVFFLVKTSNPGAADVQDERLADGRRVWERVAELVAEWGRDLVGSSGLSSAGAVVGATHADELPVARRLLPRAPFLLPGIGAQGARPADVAGAFTAAPGSALVSASRSVIYAFRETGGDWRAAAAAEAERLAGEIRSVARG